MVNEVARVVSVHVGAPGTLDKDGCARIEVALDGVVGDRHRGYSRQAGQGEKQHEGSERRNERMWSAVSLEELAEISQAMGLAEPLSASSLGANICVEGIASLSRLPRGSVLEFSSGAVLMVEEYNPPCVEMDASLARNYRSAAGAPLDKGAFSGAAKFLRGIVGVVEVAGTISSGDGIRVVPESSPRWLQQ